MHIKSIECESGNHDACCNYTDEDEDDEEYTLGWRCECRCHIKKQAQSHILSCPNCGSENLYNLDRETDEGLVSFICSDCLSRTSTTVPDIEDDEEICECDFVDENSCEIIKGVVYCCTCGGKVDDDRL